MLVNLLVLFFSLAALAYCLRYAVVSILKREGGTGEAERLAEANRLEFPQIRRMLEHTADADYSSLAQALRHDFLVLIYLLRCAATGSEGRYSRQERLLMVDFHLMRALCLLLRPFSARGARFALLEMTAILEHFACLISRRMASFPLDMLKA